MKRKEKRKRDRLGSKAGGVHLQTDAIAYTAGTLQPEPEPEPPRRRKKARGKRHVDEQDVFMLPKEARRKEMAHIRKEAKRKQKQAAIDEERTQAYFVARRRQELQLASDKSRRRELGGKRGADRAAQERRQKRLGDACAKGSEAGVRAALDAGADPTVATGGPDGTWMAAYLAAEFGHVAALAVVLDAPDVDPNVGETTTGETPLHAACATDKPEAVRVLLQHGGCLFALRVPRR